MKIINVAFNTATLKIETFVADVIKESPGIVNVCDNIKQFPRTRILKAELNQIHYDTMNRKNPTTCDNLDIYVWSTCNDDEIESTIAHWRRQILIFARTEIMSRAKDLLRIKSGIESLITK
jgi:hypothetical protein